MLLLEDASAPETGRVLGALGLPPFAPATRAGTSFSEVGLYDKLNSTALAHLEAMHAYDMILYEAAKVKARQTMAAFLLRSYFLRPGGRRGRVWSMRLQARA